MMRFGFFAAAVLLPLLAAAENSSTPTATPAEELTVAPGFKAELLRSAKPAEGSWISMAMDGRGRLYLASQGQKPKPGVTAEDVLGGIWRATLDAQGHVTQFDKVPVPIGDAMGMLWAFDSLYVSGNGPEGRAIYRLKDSKGSDTLDSWTLFKKFPDGIGEHGAHALVLGPDGKSIYIVNGNGTSLPDGISPDSPYRNYAEEELLPRVYDPNSNSPEKVKSPCGYVLKTDENGTKWELIAGGLRNCYDIAFNAEGELFTFDSDAEREVDLPWYRPTRILHLVPGGEYGFREGSLKWPDYYFDSLPASVDIGLGCPTGLKFGTLSNFPAKYQSAFFVLDWTFGRILAIHLHPKGATYTARNEVPLYHLTTPANSDDVEEFLRGKGMPVTALQFGKDGAMYFTTGGRGTQAGLYRVSYVGSSAADARSGGGKGTPTTLAQTGLEEEAQGQIDRNRRREIERLYGLNPGTVFKPSIGRAMEALKSPDRFFNAAGRHFVEQMAPSRVREMLGQNVDPRSALTCALALARIGTKDDQEALLQAIARFPLDSLDEELKLDKLRVMKVAFARQGRPNTDLVEAEIKELSRQYPAKSFPLNRELCELLVYLGAPDLVGKSLALMDQAKEPAEQIWYALCLREAGNWTPVQRERYFSWFSGMQDYHGGGSERKFILRIRNQALEKLPEADRPALLALAEKTVAKPRQQFTMPARPFVKNWAITDLEPALSGVNKGRDFARGKRLFGEVLCAQCHLFAGGGGLAAGGSVGPDLTAIGGRFSARDIVNKILDPSKAINEQYASYLFTMKDHTIFGGQIADENHFLVTVVVDPFNGTKENLPRQNIVSREVSHISLMPPGLLMTLSQDEILDLVAYLQSGGNEKAAAFQP
jgi:putative heme-binding domain-containing protein